MFAVLSGKPAYAVGMLTLTRRLAGGQADRAVCLPLFAPSWNLEENRCSNKFAVAARHIAHIQAIPYKFCG